MRLEQKPAFMVAGVKTRISGQHNEEFAEFWQVCTDDGTCEKMQRVSSCPTDNVTHSRIMGVSRVENDPTNRSFDFYIASETDEVDTSMMKKALSELDREKDITVSTFREGDEKGTAPRALYRKFGFTEGELIEEFGYPNQVFVLRRSISVCCCSRDKSGIMQQPENGKN